MKNHTTILIIQIIRMNQLLNYLVVSLRFKLKEEMKLCLNQEIQVLGVLVILVLMEYR